MGRWMNKADFTEQVVFDCRDQKQKQLRKEFRRDLTLISNFNIWHEPPTILAYEDVQK